MNHYKAIFYANLFLFFFFFETTNIYANHLVGGELTYECLGDNQFRVDLTIYRDCNSDGAPFDNPAALFLKDPNTGDFLQYENFYRIPVFLNIADTLLIPSEDSITNCPLVSLTDICVSRAVYSIELNLPPKEGGYEIIYQRCCRNIGVINVNNANETGSTYAIFLPHEVENDCKNNSPYFNNLPPTAICVNEPIVFDHSATDLDGDDLVYSLCTPFDGAQVNCPGNPIFDNQGVNYIGPNLCVSLTGNFEDVVPSDFNPILWLGDFSENNQLGNLANPLSIDPETGILTGTPTNIGLYVVGICVSEYRDGELISTKSRDFQFNVIGCGSEAVSNGSFTGATEIDGDSFLEACVGETFNFEHTGFPDAPFFWDFGVIDGEEITSTETFPFVVYPDTGNYEVIVMLDGGGECQYTDTLFLHVSEDYCIVESIEEVNNIDFTFGPNPFSEQFSIQYNLPSPTQLKVVLFNQLGQEIILTEDFKMMGAQEEFYSLDLANGLYFLSVFAEDQLVYSDRLVKVQ